MVICVGAGLRCDTPTDMNDGRILPAGLALVAGPPSDAMRLLADRVAWWVSGRGGRAVHHRDDADARSDRPGGLAVSWEGGPTPAEVAEWLGEVPCWLTLARTDEPDLRYEAI